MKEEGWTKLLLVRYPSWYILWSRDNVLCLGQIPGFRQCCTRFHVVRGIVTCRSKRYALDQMTRDTGVELLPLMGVGPVCVSREVATS